MFIGVDPGLSRLGYGIIEECNDRLKCIKYGVIYTSSLDTIPQRLINIYDQMNELMVKYQPRHIILEKIFFNKNVKTAFNVGQVRGIIFLAAAQREIKSYEYTPLQVKKAVTGYGHADKKQVQELVKIILNLPEVPGPDDAADALAVALCHIQTYRLQEQMEGLT